jgi:hypothetical protein
MKKLSEGFTEAFPVLPSDYGTLKGHSPIRRRFRDDRLESVARRAGRFRRHQGRIKQFAQQMGYVPDSSAQGLRTKTTKLFGLVIPSITNPIYARIVFAIEERAHELGYDVLLAHSLNKPDARSIASAACFRGAWTGFSFRRFIALKPRRGFIRKFWRAKRRRSCSVRPRRSAKCFPAWKPRNSSPATTPRSIF